MTCVRHDRLPRLQLPCDLRITLPVAGIMTPIASPGARPGAWRVSNLVQDFFESAMKDASHQGPKHVQNWASISADAAANQ